MMSQRISLSTGPTCKKKRRGSRGAIDPVSCRDAYLAISRIGVAVPTPEVVLVFAH